MIDFKKEMLEGEVTEVDKFLQNVEKIFLNSFPNGWFEGYVSNNIGLSLHISFGLISNLNDVRYKIRKNDPMFSTMMISPTDEVDFNNGLVVFDVEDKLSINPKEGSYMAMSFIKLGLRKQKKTDFTKLQNMFKRLFPKTKKIVLDNWDNIYQVDNIPKKYKP